MPGTVGHGPSKHKIYTKGTSNFQLACVSSTNVLGLELHTQVHRPSGLWLEKEAHSAFRMKVLNESEVKKWWAKKAH